MSDTTASDFDQDDFNVISSQYKACLEKTSMDIGRSWFRYMGKENACKEKRRRYVLQALLGSVQAWRYMADCSEVVLGSWEMIDHEPLYKLINRINWSSPDSEGFSVLTKELNRLMKRVSKQVHDSALAARNEVAMMEIELIERGILAPDSDDDLDSTADSSEGAQGVSRSSTMDHGYTGTRNGDKMAIEDSTIELSSTDDEEWRASDEFITNSSLQTR